MPVTEAPLELIILVEPANEVVVVQEISSETVIISEEPTEAIVVQEGQKGAAGSIGAVGATGATGPQGVAGTPSFQFNQASPALVWTINHNLGFKPVVSTYSVGGAEFTSQVVHVSNNQVQVLLTSALAGFSRLI